MGEQRIGDWIQTCSGRRFWPLDPRPEDVCVEDIAHSLSMKCRFGGHCLRFYSVAEHSVLVSHYVDPEYALWALLHDAAEAYLADVPRPVKPSLTGWREAEAAVMRAVCERFGLPPNEPRQVKAADVAVLGDEKRVLMADGPAWAYLPRGVGADVRGLAPDEAKAAFLARFAELTEAR